MISLRFAPRAVALLLAVILPLAAAPAQAAEDSAGFIADLGQRTVKVLASKLSEREREAQFRVIFDEGFDVPAISRFVLGQYWRTATDAQRQDFVALFEAYVVHAYAVRFNEYAGQQLQVIAARPEGDASSLVQSRIAQPNGAPPLKVDWRVGKTPNGYKINDVVVEGVSMAVTQRQEFASVIQRNGGQIDALLKLLREKAGQSNSARG
jgi:phospholipid transport system substrate-binding protein